MGKSDRVRIPVVYTEYDINGESLFTLKLVARLCIGETPPILDIQLPLTRIEKGLGMGKNLSIRVKDLGIHAPEKVE